MFIKYLSNQLHNLRINWYYVGIVGIKESFTDKFLVFAGKEGSWLTTLCKTPWENCQSVKKTLQRIQVFLPLQYIIKMMKGNFIVWWPRVGTTVEHVWPLSPQVAFHKKPKCYHDKYNHRGSGTLWKTTILQE